MAMNPVLEAESQDVRLNDLIVSKIVEMGCACAPDLAGQIGGGMKARDLVQPLESLVKRGILRHKQDPSDTREYNEYQTVYELAR
jgi:hypothetical protein